MARSSQRQCAKQLAGRGTLRVYHDPPPVIKPSHRVASHCDDGRRCGILAGKHCELLGSLGDSVGAGRQPISWAQQGVLEVSCKWVGRRRWVLCEGWNLGPCPNVRCVTLPLGWVHWLAAWPILPALSVQCSEVQRGAARQGTWHLYLAFLYFIRTSANFTP